MISRPSPDDLKPLQVLARFVQKCTVRDERQTPVTTRS